jgi:hypothetical protein
VKDCIGDVREIFIDKIESERERWNRGRTTKDKIRMRIRMM